MFRGMIRACPHIHAMRLEWWRGCYSMVRDWGNSARPPRGGWGCDGQSTLFSACQDFLLWRIWAGCTNLRWLRLTALKSSPVTAFGSEVLSVSGQHPEPLPYYRASRDQVYLGFMVSGTLPVSLVIHRPGDRTKFTLSWVI